MVGTSWGVDPVLRAPPCAVKDGEVEGPLGARPGLWGGPQLSSLGAYRVVGQAGDTFGPVHECEGTVSGGEPQPLTRPCSVEPKTFGLNWTDTLGPVMGRTFDQQLSGAEGGRWWSQPSVLPMGNPGPQPDQPIA